MSTTTPVRAALAVALLAAAGAVHAAGAPAGAQISNTAQVSYTLAGGNVTMPSNTVTLTVAEIVDVVVTLQTPTVAVTPGAANQVQVDRVTNTGNGSETFQLAMTSVLGGDDFDPTPAAPAIYFDIDASGTLTAADTPYTAGGNDPTLAADAFTTLLVVNNIPGALANGARGLSRLTAASRTGTGTPGTVFAGQGTGGTDAVVGTSGGDGEATGEYQVADIQVTALKSATVVDPFGGSRPVPGARVNYQVVVTPTGSGSAGTAVFSDPIPANTTYVAGSLRLNGTPLSDDASDADAGSYLTVPQRAVRVALGNLTQASGPQTIVFAVTIN
ncbi:MAG: hypothetical protein U1F11_07145 [Steroidobacteraceae bacterium]